MRKLFIFLGMFVFVLEMSGQIRVGYNGGKGKAIYSNWLDYMGENVEINLGDSTSTPCIQPDENGFIEIQIKVCLSDNNLSNYPPIYLYYKVGSLSEGRGLLNNFDLTVLSNEIIGYEEDVPVLSNIYEYSCTLNVDLNNESESFDYRFALQNESGSLLESEIQNTLYPISAYPNLIMYYQGGELPQWRASLMKSHIGTLGEKEFCTPNGIVKGQLLGEIETTLRLANTIGEVVSFDVPKIYPNPFTTQVTIDYNTIEAEATEIQLFDMNGKLIYREVVETDYGGEHSHTINTEELTKGMYVCRIKQSDETHSFPLVHM